MIIGTTVLRHLSVAARVITALISSLKLVILEICDFSYSCPGNIFSIYI